MWILYYKSSDDDIDADRIAKWLAQLPETKRLAVQRRLRHDSRKLSLLGWQLLRFGMQLAGHASFALEQIEFPLHGKPHIAGDWDFNLSHSGDIVTCAISRKGRIGIDVERLRNVEPLRFKRYFTGEELVWMGSDARRFIELWTQKEAVIKASGIGLKGLSKVKTHHNRRASDPQGEWFLYPLDLDAGYRAHVAIDLADVQLSPPQQVTLAQLDDN